MGALLIAVCAAGVVWAQGAAPAPKDPLALMVLAARTNGLAGMEGHAWHVTAKYQIFDADGKPEQSGVYEEWWAGPKKYKVQYSQPGFAQTKYVNGAARAVSGSAGWAPQQVSMATDYLLRPLPAAGVVSKQKYQALDRKIYGDAMRCVYPRSMPVGLEKKTRMEAAAGEADFTVPVTCFDHGTAAIRVEEDANNGLYAVFSRVLNAGGHWVLQDVAVEDGGVPIVKLEVTKLEFPASIAESVFEAPADAAVTPPRSLSRKVESGRRVGGILPWYPQEAKNEGVQGLVILGAVIDKTGSIADLEEIAGPKLLRGAAAQAVKTWKYKPYLLNGKPVEVETRIDVVFSISD